MTDADELRKLIHKMQQDNAAGGIERFRDVRSFRYQDVEDLVNAAGSLLDDRDRLAAENARLRAALQAISEEKQLGIGMSEYVHGRSAAAIAREALTRKEG